MKIILVGASGDVGRAAHEALSKCHEVIRAGRTTGEVNVDITDRRSIEAMYDRVGSFDAVVSAAGNVHFAPLVEQTEASLKMGLENKVMGQINLFLSGMSRIATGGFLHADKRGAGSGSSGVWYRRSYGKWCLGWFRNRRRNRNASWVSDQRRQPRLVGYIRTSIRCAVPGPRTRLVRKSRTRLCKMCRRRDFRSSFGRWLRANS